MHLGLHECLHQVILPDKVLNQVWSNFDSRHTVEELQSFSNVRTPSPPWVHVVRLIIPMSSCDEAAIYLIKAFRGEEVMKRVVGGTKWWQVRGIRGYVFQVIFFIPRIAAWEASPSNLCRGRLDAEWISAKKHWQDVQRRANEQGSLANPRQNDSTEGLGLRNTSLERATSTAFPESESEENHESQPAPSNNEPSRDSGSYQPEMDDMRCILYSHGGTNTPLSFPSFSNSDPRGLLFW